MSKSQHSTVDQPHFVWWRGTGGKPEPQKWQGLDYGISNWKFPYVIAAYPLTPDESKQSLASLAVRYPQPVSEKQ